MMWYWGGGVHWWEWLVGLVGMIAFWGLLIGGIWYFVSSIGRRDGRDGRDGRVERRDEHVERRDDPRRILDERLARGEIDAEEYRRVRDLLRGDDARSGEERAGAGVGERP